MFKVGDKVHQLISTRRIPKGQIGEILSAHLLNRGNSSNYYEVAFDVGGKLEFALRYEREIGAVTPSMMSAAIGGPLPVGSAQTVGKPLYKVGDQVTCIKAASSYWSQSGVITNVDTYISPIIYTVEFHALIRLKTNLLERDLIASTPYKHINIQDSIPPSSSKTSKQCTCPMQGPTGLLAIGCKCGAVTPYVSARP